MTSLYCSYIKAIEKIPQEVLNNNKQQVDALFFDVNQQIRGYNSQYETLIKELGVLCSTKEDKNDIIERFFQTIKDFLKLCLTTYDSTIEEKGIFEDLTTLITKFLNKDISDFEQAQPLEKALLVQITKSAWALTNPQKDMNQVAKQIGGKLKNKTRKAKRT